MSKKVRVIKDEGNFEFHELAGNKIWNEIHVTAHVDSAELYIDSLLEMGYIDLHCYSNLNRELAKLN